MKIYKQSFENLTIVFEDGSILIQNFTPAELAGLRRSKRWKRRVSVKKNFSVEIITKFPESSEAKISRKKDPEPIEGIGEFIKDVHDFYHPKNQDND